ncbi:unnamed protein product [Arctogadus glacialis]
MPSVMDTAKSSCPGATGQPRYLPQRFPCWPTPASTSTPPPAGQPRSASTPPPAGQRRHLPLRLPLLATPDLPLRLPLLANPDLPLRLPLLANPDLPLRLPLLANAGIYLYASPCWPTPIYLYASPCWPTPIYLYASPCWPTTVSTSTPPPAGQRRRPSQSTSTHPPCWFAATPIPYPQRLPLLAETTPASLLPQHQTAASNCSPTPSPSKRAFPDVMASLDVQPRLMEAVPDPDTPAQMRAAVARYLAANALKDKALSTEQQRVWAAREEKYRKEWEQVGVWAVGVKVTTGLTTAAWEHTLKESEWAATRRVNAKKVRHRDLVNYRKKREKYTYALLNAYNAAINMEAGRREGRPTDLSRQEKTILKGLSAPPHVEERAAPLTLNGADVEGKGTPYGGENTSLRNNTYPSLEENPPFPNITRAPPPYGCYDHPAAMTSSSQYST